jgi:diketogulonate reductase-like aldo/keto reductase
MCSPNAPVWGCCRHFSSLWMSLGNARSAQLRGGIVLQAFAALGHSSEPKLLEDPVITAVAKRVNKTPAQVLLAWAIQRGTALLTTSKTPSRIKENFEVSALPEVAVREISEGIKSRIRFNAVVETGVPGFIPRGKGG